MPNIITSRPPRILVGDDQVEFSVAAFNWSVGDEALSEDGVIMKTSDLLIVFDRQERQSYPAVKTAQFHQQNLCICARLVLL